MQRAQRRNQEVLTWDRTGASSTGNQKVAHGTAMREVHSSLSSRAPLLPPLMSTVAQTPAVVTSACRFVRSLTEGLPRIGPSLQKNIEGGSTGVPSPKIYTPGLFFQDVLLNALGGWHPSP